MKHEAFVNTTALSAFVKMWREGPGGWKSLAYAAQQTADTASKQWMFASLSNTSPTPNGLDKYRIYRFEPCRFPLLYLRPQFTPQIKIYILYVSWGILWACKVILVVRP